MTARAGGTQARGRLRRRQLLDAAQALLADRELDALTLGEVAAAAGVPKASAYHFYANVYELYADLARRIGEELQHRLEQPITAPVADWQGIMSRLLKRGVDYLNAHAASRQLIWGPKSPPEIKRSDRNNDYRLGLVFQAQIARHFQLPDFPDRDRAFYFAIEIADVLFCLSMLDHGRVTDEMCGEGQRAAIAYLSLYIPPILPPVSAPASAPVSAVAAD